MMKFLPFALAPLALAISPLVLAANTIENTPTEIIITADRSLAPVAEHIDAATVITRADIERIQPASLADLIGQTTGISLPTSGGPLSTTGVFLRGFASNQILVLIDGVRANDATTGQFDLSILRPEDIERVEVLRGGYSSQYGSDAMGGVIQVFTRKQQADNSLILRAGSFKTREETLSLGTQNDKGGVSASLSQLDTAGFNAGNKNYEAANFAQPNPDRNGGTQRTLRLAGNRQLSDSQSISAQTLLKDGNTSYDNGTTASTFALAGVKYSQVMSENYQHQVDIGYQRTKLNNHDDSYGPSNYSTQRYNLDWTHTLRSQPLGTTTAGITLVNEQALTDLISRRSNNNNAVFLINEQAIGKFSYRLSGRHEHAEVWGDHNTGSIRIGYQLSKSVDAYAGYGSSFRAPTANDLYGIYGGNPDLKPETSRQRDVGLIWRVVPGHQLKLNAYHADVSNLIHADVSNLIVGMPPSYTLMNINKARLEGIEVEASGQFGDTGYQLGLLRARAEDTSNNVSLNRRPRAQLTGDIHHRLNSRYTVGVQVLARSDTPDYNVPTQGFAVFNAYANWAVTPKTTIGLRLDNLADKFYETARGYSTPARSAYVTLRYRF